ncbi:MAG: J domain-containing protein [Sediminispirochaetaceae bacterium]
MDPLIERFERILRSFLNSGAADDSWEYASEDRDFQDAYAELDEFLQSGRNKDSGGWAHSGGGTHSDGRTGTYDERFRTPPETLRQDYSRLKVPFGTSFDEVRSSYRALMRRHHPDLHSADPSRHAEATRIAQELNLSYQRIKAWELAKRGA